MRHYRIRKLASGSLLAIVASACLVTSAQAQTTADDGTSDVGDIVVTARKRTERLQDVPIAVTAISAEGLEKRGISSVTELQNIAPNLNFTPGQGGNSGGIAPFIRGVGENDFIITSDPAVGTYIDGVYVARTFGASAELMDIDRIEVLRGPQGSIFGKNTIGGAINLVTNVPGQRSKLEGDVRYGSFNDVRLRAHVVAPLSDNLSLGLSGLGEWGEGWQKVPSGKNLGNRNVVSGRATLHFANGPIDAVLSVDGLRRRQNSAAHSMIAFTPSFFSGLQSGFIAPCCTVPASINQTDTSPELNHDDADAFNTALTLSYDTDAGTLKSISAYRWVHALFGRDGDASSTLSYAGDIHNERARQFSQELQYSTPLFGDSGNLLLGAYYFRESTVDLTRLYVADGLYPLILPIFGEPLSTLLDFNLNLDNRQTTTNYAVFGNLNFKLAEALTLELGGRYTHEKKDFFQAATRIYSQQPLLAGTPSYALNRSWSSFTPRASLSYKFTPDVLAYASWSQGFRSGGFNGRPTSLEEIGSYDPEKLNAYEVGLKTRFDNIVTLNLSAFRNEYRNQQLLITTVSQTTGLLVVRTENAGRSRIQGLELEADIRVSPTFHITGALGLLDAKYLKYVSVIAGVPTDVSSRTPKQSPDITANLGLEYIIPTSANTDAVLRVDGAYRSATFIDVENTQLLKSPDHVTVNASATFGLPLSGSSLRFAVDNLTNKRVVTAGYDGTGAFGFVEAFYNQPRRFWVTLAFKR